MHETSADSHATIAIKRPRSAVFGAFGVALLLTALAVWLRDFAFGLIAIYVFALATAWARTCAFAIENEGIRLPNLRRSLIKQFWPFPNDNLYRWNEVSYGHWSHHQPGELNVQIQKTRSPGDALEQPPVRFFYPVPEQYRAEVEKALRERSKWPE